MLLQDRVMTYDLTKVESIKIAHTVMSLNFASGTVNIPLWPMTSEQQEMVDGGDVFAFIDALKNQKPHGFIVIQKNEFVKQLVDWVKS